MSVAFIIKIEEPVDVAQQVVAPSQRFSPIIPTGPSSRISSISRKMNESEFDRFDPAFFNNVGRLKPLFMHPELSRV